MKKIVAVALVVILIVCYIPQYVFATDVTVENTLADVLYGYNSDDLLSESNYIDYFTVPSDKQYLKFDAQYQRLTNNNTSEFGYTFWDDIATYWDSSTSTGLKQIAFPEHTGYKLFYWWYSGGGSGYTCQTLVVDTQGTPVIINGRLACDQSFDLYYCQYDIARDFTSYTVYPNQNSYSGVVSGSQNGNYYYFNLDTNRQCMYSEIPYLMSYYDDTNYPQGEFLTQAPYYYDNFVKVLDAYYSNSDDTGFVIDRRTAKMINGGSGGSVSPSDYGFKNGSFKNAIYGSTFDDQNIFIAYELNDQSSTIKNDLYLRLDYIFDLDGVFNNYDLDYSGQYSTIQGKYDLYSLSDSNYVNVDLDDVFRDMAYYPSTNGTLFTQYENIDKYYDPSKYSSYVSSPRHSIDPLNCFEILYKNGLITSKPVSINYNDEFLESMTVSYKDFGFGVKINTNAIYNSTGIPSINRLDSCYLTVVESIYNVVTGELSNAYMFSYDYATKTMTEVGTLENGNEVFDGNYSNGSQSLGNPNSNDLNYDIATGTYYPSNAYGGSSSAYNGGNSVIVNPQQIPYLLVDIPENEWMSYTPNLTSILDTFKVMLAQTQEESVLPMIAETYNYFPAPVMQYLIYGVGLIVMIGIWKAITRR